MKKILFALALVLAASSAQALSLSAPEEVAANSAFSVFVEFDPLDSFNEAVVQLNGSTIVSLETVGNSGMWIKSIDESVVLNLKEGNLVEGNSIYILLGGFASEGSNDVKVEEIGKAQKTQTISVFTPVSKDFEEEYLEQFNSLKNTIMSYANDIDDLKEKVADLEGLIAGKASSAEIEGKLNEINSALESIQSELSSKASLEDVGSLEQAVGEQAAKLGELEQETEEFVSTGFVSFGALQNETNLTILAAIVVIIVIVVLIAKGKVTLPELPKPKLRRKEKSIYKPSEKEKEITSRVLEESGGKKKEGAEGSGKWAFKSGS